MSALHHDGIPNYGSFLNGYSRTYNRIDHLPVNLCSLAYDTAFDFCIICYVLRRDYIALGIDLPVFLIKIKLRNNVDQLHIGLPVRSQSTYVLPVAVVFICKNAVSLSVTVRNNVLSEVTSGFVL